MDRVRALFFSLRDRFLALSPTRRFLLLSGVSLVFILFVFGSLFLFKPQMAPLFTHLSSSDGAAIVAKLKEQKIPYELKDSGTTILVPKDKVYELRLSLAAQGLPEGSGVGFEIFDKNNLFTTDFTQRVDYVRALQGELARTISQINGVEGARVHIVLPKTGVFVSQDIPASASVMLNLKPGQSISEKETEAIAFLVSRAVEGLKPENVTIMDTRGELLSADLNFNKSGLSQREFDIKRKYESEVQRKIQTMLDTMLGPGKSVVRVSAELNLASSEVKKITYSPVVGQNGIVISSKVTTDTSKSQNTTPQTPSATVPQGIPSYQTPAPTSSSSSRKTEEITNYDVNKQEEMIKNPSGDIKRLTVSVIVDGTPQTVNLQALTAAVSNAAGILPQRGDSVDVQAMPFDRTYQQKELQAMQQAQLMDTIKSIAMWVAIVIAAIIAIIFLRRTIASLKKSQEQRGAQILDATVGAEGIIHEKPLTPEELARKKARDEVERLAKEKPSEVANLIKTWLREE
ncbi:flagellar M-ring protein FliF [Thermodesulfobium narugense DSM 14796]|uniref:Flagellar M-ring protein n=1 Tax=Thermodesulfobium narugense DSM 14796 TaxID=747365 RepID=M1E7J7_9BACT|nr:flagellar basal-body MS-ring/collar protein FliF [Thermodesulfobium narugense]AEE15296.1 flagellar M-ring protein FliF [Thermodesulfobium narugense DSM 14796]